MFVSPVVALLAFGPTVFGIAFPGPAPTAAGEANLHGFTPKPTGGPPSLPELLRRQSKDDGLCGYLGGESDAPVSCSVGSCLYDDSLSWFGCCTGSARSDCQLFTSCVGSASIDSCLSNSQCANDDYALACTASTAGVCMTMWEEVDEGTVSHYVCGSSSTRVQVLATPTDVSSASSSTVRSSATAFSSGGGLPRPSSGRQTSSSSDDDVTESTSSVQSSRSTSSSLETTPRISSAPSASARSATTRSATTAASTAGAMKSAQAVVGAIGGFAGLVAWFV